MQVDVKKYSIIFVFVLAFIVFLYFHREALIMPLPIIGPLLYYFLSLFMIPMVLAGLFFIWLIGLIVISLWGEKSEPFSNSIIILNGPSGAGKSSIQKEFQKLMMPDLWVKVGIDNLFDSVMPDITPDNLSYWKTKNNIRWVEESEDAGGNNIITLCVGEEGEKVAYAMNSAIAAYAQAECNVIVDYIAYKKEWFDDLEEKLSPYNVFYVAVDISLEVLEQREEARGTSPKGHARSHFHSVYRDKEYDMRVNSEKNSAHEIAKELKKLVKK